MSYDVFVAQNSARPTAPGVHGWFGLFNNYRACEAARPSARLNFGPSRDINIRQFMNVQTSLNFYGRTEEAVNFYRKTLGAETLFMMRFRERPDRAQVKPGTEEKIFHATIRIGSTEIMASDCGCENSPTETFGGFSLAIHVETPEKAERIFKALSDGGRILIPMVETFFATRYGIVIDRFGVSWKIIAASKRQSGDTERR